MPSVLEQIRGICQPCRDLFIADLPFDCEKGPYCKTWVCQHCHRQGDLGGEAYSSCTFPWPARTIPKELRGAWAQFVVLYGQDCRKSEGGHLKRIRRYATDSGRDESTTEDSSLKSPQTTETEGAGTTNITETHDQEDSLLITFSFQDTGRLKLALDGHLPAVRANLIPVDGIGQSSILPNPDVGVDSTDRATLTLRDIVAQAASDYLSQSGTAPKKQAAQVTRDDNHKVSTSEVAPVKSPAMLSQSIITKGLRHSPDFSIAPKRPPTPPDSVHDDQSVATSSAKTSPLVDSFRDQTPDLVRPSTTVQGDSKISMPAQDGSASPVTKRRKLHQGLPERTRSTSEAAPETPAVTHLQRVDAAFSNATLLGRFDSAAARRNTDPMDVSSTESVVTTAPPASKSPTELISPVEQQVTLKSGTPIDLSRQLSPSAPVRAVSPEDKPLSAEKAHQVKCTADQAGLHTAKLSRDMPTADDYITMMTAPKKGIDSLAISTPSASSVVAQDIQFTPVNANQKRAADLNQETEPTAVPKRQYKRRRQVSDATALPKLAPASSNEMPLDHAEGPLANEKYMGTVLSSRSQADEAQQQVAIAKESIAGRTHAYPFLNKGKNNAQIHGSAPCRIDTIHDPVTGSLDTLHPKSATIILPASRPQWPSQASAPLPSQIAHHIVNRESSHLHHDRRATVSEVKPDHNQTLQKPSTTAQTALPGVDYRSVYAPYAPAPTPQKISLDNSGSRDRSLAQSRALPQIHTRELSDMPRLQANKQNVPMSGTRPSRMPQPAHIHRPGHPAATAPPHPVMAAPVPTPQVNTSAAHVRQERWLPQEPQYPVTRAPQPAENRVQHVTAAVQPPSPGSRSYPHGFVPLSPLANPRLQHTHHTKISVNIDDSPDTEIFRLGNISSSHEFVGRVLEKANIHAIAVDKFRITFNWLPREKRGRTFIMRIGDEEDGFGHIHDEIMAKFHRDGYSVTNVQVDVISKH